MRFRLILFSVASLVLLPISTLADEITVTASDPDEIYMNHQGLIPILRVNASGGSSISSSLLEARTRMFNDPTMVTINILQLMGRDGEFGATDRRWSDEDQLDLVKTFAERPGIHHHFKRHHFKGHDSDDFDSHRGDKNGDEDNSDADTDDDWAADGAVAETPEPTSLLLLGTGLLSLLALKKFM
jgi:hypothetical protein